MSNNNDQPWSLDFHYAHGKPSVSGIIKSRPEDFIVDEIHAEQFAGDGEHYYLFIEKQQENTQWIAKQLARYCHVEEKSIGYAGLKDRNAVTRQWFSVQMPGVNHVDWRGFDQANWRILKTARHNKKLRRGEHLGNRFTLTLRDITPSQSASEMESRLETIQHVGVPNYFGEQRFGIEGENLRLAEQWFVSGKKIKQRRQKSFVMSAARSYLFNVLLSDRVAAGNWYQTTVGDLVQAGVPTGPLWGRGRLATTEHALALEQELQQRYPSWCDALEHLGLKQERRSLCLQPEKLSWQWFDAELVLSFTLPVGQFATSLLRELIDYTTALVTK